MFQRCGAGPYFRVTIRMGCLLRRFRLNPAIQAMSGYEPAIRQFQIWTEFWRITPAKFLEPRLYTGNGTSPVRRRSANRSQQAIRRLRLLIFMRKYLAVIAFDGEQDPSHILRISKCIPCCVRNA